jgi:hypothetical protein
MRTCLREIRSWKVARGNSQTASGIDVTMNDAPAPLLPDPKARTEYYRARAEEVRKRAASIRSAAARSKFLEIAQTYDTLAWQVEAMADEPEAARGHLKAAE